MIRLSGLKVKDKSSKDGDIELIYTGLRPGEKLYEELLINSDSIATEHPLIFRSNEPFLTYGELWPKLDLLEKKLNNAETNKILELILQMVPNAGFDNFSDQHNLKHL